MRISLSEAARRLCNGEVIAVPTDTVYGLAASLSHLEAIEQLFTIKRRPPSNPLVIQLPHRTYLGSFVPNLPSDFSKLADRYWPGALTIVLPIDVDKVHAVVRANKPTAGFRVPAHPLMLELLHLTGPLVVPSANFSSQPPATTAEGVEEAFGRHFPVLDGGACEKGVASTLLCFQTRLLEQNTSVIQNPRLLVGKWMITRLGAISPEELQNTLGYLPEIE